SCSLIAVYMASAIAALPQLDEGVVKTESTVTKQDGSVVHITKLADVDCNMEQVTSKEADGSVSAVVTDYQKGKTVLLKSTAPDVCYVHDIPQDQKDLQGEYCVDGVTYIHRSKLHPKDRIYEEKGEASRDELSDDLAEPCQGRRLVALSEVTITQDETPRTEKRITHVHTCPNGHQACHFVPVCHDVCVDHGWWWGQHHCHNYESRCENHQTCDYACF
ncbi:hypothetical protein BaRGS_00034297, partial [Batillaria attramentaria]